ncbi:HAD family hydrolase [Desulfurivibrio alkaliphilus]|uniref:HAD-superfamily hydrolase, subfamily IA, variant 3 n=1 Tax=Desulfurivibrio alkaliphilus (strain DSM 19089 / UNIQEM U267 / AHT2) TaxID=589865 RepID=D6Z1G0_DESAT|nr:HAD family phosphatase [Desulfurivibrio alkaliphilus]ADH85415.1 HAD-superfamily hydrolase, subfamily IA, variant 3 [Desulfurivibrio alkaliphilus AHT 2]
MSDYTTIMFDFGGVVAAEGFRTGLEAIGGEHGLDPAETFRLGKEIVFDGGYVVGAVDEAAYWNEFRRRTGIVASNTELRRHILDRFRPYPEMLAALARLRQLGFTLVMVSDQTNWLDELNERHQFFPLFHRVFNSYHHGRSKRDSRFFIEVLAELNSPPAAAIFLDDDPGNVERAQSVGINTVLVTSPRQALKELAQILGVIDL